MFRPRTAVGALALLALLPTTAEAGGRNPGSVGIFPVHNSDVTMVDPCMDEGIDCKKQTAAPVSPALTILSITNTNTSPVDGGTLVHFEYVNVAVNPNDPFSPFGCTVFDRIELLTPADTLSVLTECHNPAGLGARGYVVVSAQDPSQFNTPWDFDYLIGSELVLFGSGAAFSLPMIPFEALPGDGLPTDLLGPQGQPPNGQLDFDGREYEAISDRHAIDSSIAAVDSELVLINLTGGPNTFNTVLFNVWNDNEFPLSATRTFKCWFAQPLSEVSPLFTQAFLAQNTPDDPDELAITCGPMPVTLETSWSILESIDVSETGGTFVSPDGALLGAIVSGPSTLVAGAHLLWEVDLTKQVNGSFLQP